MEKTVIITGAAGFVGRYIAEKELSAGNKVVAITRSSKTSLARERVMNAIAFVNPYCNYTGDQLVVLEGDITKLNCGLSKTDITMLRKLNVDEFWHVASSTAFSDAKHDETFMTNVQGTSYVLSVCSAINPKKFIYTSTSWVGKKSGTLYEHELPAEQDFNNSYEASKFQAEKMIHEWSQHHSDIVIQIMRPCIIVGDTVTGKTCCFTGYYYYMRSWVLLLTWLNRMKLVMPKRDLNGKIPLQIKVPGFDVAPLHIIPVDIAIDQMYKLSLTDEPGTFNITPEEPASYGYWLKEGTEHIGFVGVVADDGKTPRFTGLLRDLLDRIVSGISDYIPYISMPLHFCNANTRRVLGSDYVPCPKINSQFIQLILDYAIQHKFKE